MHSGLLPRLDVHPQPGIAPYLAEVPRPYTPTPPVDIPPPNTLPPPMSILPPNTFAPSMSLPPPSTLPPLMGLPPPNTLPLPIGIGYSQPYPGNLPPSVPSGGLPAPPPPPVGDFLGPPPLPPGGLLAPPPLPPDGRPAPPPLPPDGLPAPPPLPPGGLHIPFPMVRTPPVGTPYFPSSVVTLPPAGVPLLPAGVPLLPVGMPLQPLLEARPLPPTPPTLHRHPEQIAVRPPRSPVANDSSTPASASTATPAPGVRKEPVYEQEEERSLKKIYEVDPLAALERQEPVEQPAKKKVKRQDPYACQGILNVKAKDATGKVTVYSSADMPVAEKDKKKTLPPGWEERMSKSKKKPYFVNAKTGEATWGRPIVVKNTLQKGPASSSVKTSKSIWNKWQTTSQALRREEEEDD